MYAAFTAVYQPNPTISDPIVATTARRSCVHSSPRGRTSAASPAIIGKTPTPTASAPTAQSPFSSMRSL